MDESNVAVKLKDEANQTLFEILASIRHLENQQHIITQLIEAKAQHHVEITYIKTSVDRQVRELAKINNRLEKIEHFIEIKKEKRNQGKVLYGFIEIIRTYWHIIAITASVISAFLSYHFGLKIEG